MRSIIVFACTFLLAVVAFVVYVTFQADAPRAVQTQVKPIEPIPTSQPVAVDVDSNGQDQSIIKSGTGVWVVQRDKDTAELVRRFRADQFDPLPNNDIRVTNPEAEFYLSDGQILAITGTTGDITVEGSAPTTERRAPSQTPTRGFLNEVTINLFDSTEQYDAKSPSLTISMPNASFDNDTFRIQTQSYTAPDGKTVPPDKVPIVMRGADYDFDGEGLVIKWNERDRRLESMQVAHGGRMLVKDPSKFTQSRSGDATTRPVSIDRPVQATGDLLHFDFQMQPAAETTTAATTRQRRQQIRAYRATFHNEIKITSTPPPTPAPTTQPAPQPILVTWNGPLTVVPLAAAEAREQRLGPDDTAIHLEGAPMVIQQEGSEIRAAKMTFLTSDSTLQLRRSDAIAVTMTDPNGMTITTDWMDFSEGTGRALLKGPSKAVMPIEGDPQPLVAQWNDQCVLRMVGSGKAMKMQMARLEGDVRVQHPQIALTSGMLELRFDPDAAKEKDLALRRLEAEKNVQCEIKDPSNPQSIAAEHLTMQMDSAKGKMYPRELKADGNVHTKDAQQELWARELEVVLEPAAAKPDAKPQAEGEKVAAVQLRRLRAHQDVKVLTKDGDSAEAEQLVVEATNGQPESIRLVGTPARVQSKESSVAGPLIVGNPREQKWRVVGAGTMHAVQRETPESPPRPMDVSWTDHVSVDALANTIAVEGDVDAVSVDPDGTITSAKGRRLDMTLIDKPAGDAPVEADPKSQGIASMNLMQNKQINTVVLRDDVKIESILADASSGSVLRQLNLFANAVDYQMPAQTMTIPGAGRMLYVDRQAPEGSTESDARGATAFEWHEQLSYQESARQISMTGQVVIVHESDSDPGRPIRMEADRVTALLAAPPATLPASGASESRLQVDLVLAEGNLTFRGNDMLVIAEQMEFFPQTNRLIARGNPRVPAVIYNNNGIVQATAEEITINTSTWQLRTKNSAGSVRR